MKRRGSLKNVLVDELKLNLITSSLYSHTFAIEIRIF